MGSEKRSTIINFIFSSYIDKVIKSKRLKWADHVARMQEGITAFKILRGKPTGMRPL